jgi:antitoxin component YwqK of YwqJK toxin-antitoxin module
MKLNGLKNGLSKEKIFFMTIVLLSTILCLADQGIGEVVRKTQWVDKKGHYEIFFLKDGLEIARQKIAGKSEVIEQEGKIPDGIIREYYDSGELMMEAQYKNDRSNGITKTYYKTGVLYQENNYRVGVEDGISRTFYENGQLKFEKNYKNGGLIAVKHFSQDGTGESSYKDGEILSQKLFNESGDIEYEINFKNSKPISKKGYGNGKVVSEENF